MALTTEFFVLVLDPKSECRTEDVEILHNVRSYVGLHPTDPDLFVIFPYIAPLNEENHVLNGRHVVLSLYSGTRKCDVFLQEFKLQPCGMQKSCVATDPISSKIVFTAPAFLLPKGGPFILHATLVP